MEISLIRHGKSQFIHNGKVNLKEFEQWIRNYDLHGISEEPFCPAETFQKVTAADIIITSDLKRSVESAKLLNPQKAVIADPLFRETELPIGAIRAFNIRLSPGFWAVLLRLLWFGGYSTKCESLSEAKLRAKKAAQRLIDYSGESKTVALIGHGFFNMMIAKELQKKGWRGERKPGAKHWNCVSYSLQK
ncbi:histidine phosphatase family protein [Planomicrobium sp. CPCC 101079]|uniref:histidine phosphatase family protein n=1 Tax=Planomicrobium sp. CPCC 101079 TaxID=2599618 RepID=UPI0011B4B1E9|nr:histidine phosphatase family protein [Planomicrobium sp. CPCC 101079]TWT00542.1 histidine phosphatase family protein [Planomicrobium sp. CPCC 101079]